MMSKKVKQRIAVDFDGVIHDYTKGWQDGSIYGEPVPDSLETIVKLSEKFEVYIFTTRAREERKQEVEIREWLKNNVCQKGLGDKAYELFHNIVITDKKIPAIAYIDDRGIRFTNWNDIKKYFI